MQRLVRLFAHPLARYLAGAGVLALAGTLLLHGASAKPVTLVVNGQTRQITSHARTVEGLLSQSGVWLGSNDRVVPPLDTQLSRGQEIIVDTARHVLVEADGEIVPVDTLSRSPSNILAQARTPLFPGDRVLADGVRVKDPSTELAGIPFRLRVQRANTLSVEIDGVEWQFRSAAPTLGEALWENGISIYVGDRLIPAPETSLPFSGPVVLHRSQPVRIQVDDQTLQARTAAATVGDALADTGVALVGLDYARPALQEPIPEDGHIEVVRVREDVLVEQRPIPFETLQQPDPTLEIDQKRLISSGSYGVVSNRVRVRLENGQEVSRVVEGEWISHEPEPRVFGYGTKIVIRTLDTPGGPVEYWRAVEMYATSYSPCRSGVDRCIYGTASGATVQKGIVALITRLYLQMKGQQVYIDGYGVGTVADTGGGFSDHRLWIDLGYSDDDYVNWHYWKTVYFLTPVPSNILWILN